MPKSRFPKVTSRKTSTPQSAANLGLSVTRQIVSLLSHGSSGGTPSSLAGIVNLLGGAQSNAGSQAALAANTAALTANTSALLANTSALAANTASNGAESVSNAGGGALSLLGRGASEASGGLFGSLLGSFSSLLGIASLGSSLFGLFSGSSPQPILTPYQGPASQSLEVAGSDNIQSGLTRVDWSANGTPRSYSAAPAAASSQPLQVTVNVSAMDARSFQDYAPQLADAVRQAMLNMNPINQLIRESL